LKAPGFSYDYNYNGTSTDTVGQIMKYRIEHVLKADIDLTFFECFSLGIAVQYYSLMKNIDKCFYEFDPQSSIAPPYVQETNMKLPFEGLEDYMEGHKKGTWIFGLRTSVEMWNVKLSLIVNNLFNREYSLRPMAPETPRTTTVQLLYKFTEGEGFFPKKRKNS
jgi:outer membrane receptor for Fe3+-dicitrate